MQLRLLQNYFVISLPHLACEVLCNIGVEKHFFTSLTTKNQVEWHILPGWDVYKFLLTCLPRYGPELHPKSRLIPLRAFKQIPLSYNYKSSRRGNLRWITHWITKVTWIGFPSKFLIMKELCCKSLIHGTPRSKFSQNDAKVMVMRLFLRAFMFLTIYVDVCVTIYTLPVAYCSVFLVSSTISISLSYVYLMYCSICLVDIHLSFQELENLAQVVKPDKS